MATRSARRHPLIRLFWQEGHTGWWMILPVSIGLFLGGSGLFLLYRWYGSTQPELQPLPPTEKIVYVTASPVATPVSNGTVGFTVPATATPVPSASITLVSPTTKTTTTTATSSMISGVLSISGPLAAKSSVLILYKQTGQANWQTWQRMSPTDGAIWKITGLKNGTSYQVTAALQVNEQNSAVSPTLTLAAPTANQVLRLETGVSLAAPSHAPHLQSCDVFQENGKWKAKIAFEKVESAGSYWLQIGTEAGMSNYANVKKNTTGAGEEVYTVELDNQRNLYARYGYALCTDCTASHNFSPMSESATLYCTP